MGWTIALHDELGTIVQVPAFVYGSTIAIHEDVPATIDAEMDLTYNYAQHYCTAMHPEEGLHWLHGKRAGETLTRLEHAIKLLGTVRDNNYWEATPGNAGHALLYFRDWARQHPDAIWQVT